MKNKRWTVKRTVIELYQVEAPTRQQALSNVSDPYSVTVKSESAKLHKDQQFVETIGGGK